MEENSIQKEWEEITKIREEKIIHSDGTVSGCAGCGGMSVNGENIGIEGYTNLKRAERLNDILNDENDGK